MKYRMDPLWSLALFAAASAVGPRAAASPATTDDRYQFLVDSVSTKIDFSAATSLGDCSFPAGTSGTLVGHEFYQLHAGVLPLESGSCDGGDCQCMPDFVGIIPNSIPGGPNLLELDFVNLHLSPTSPEFNITNGVFDTTESCSCLQGTMVVHLLGHAALNVPLNGLVTDSEHSHGTILIDHGGIHVARQFSNRLNIDVPALAMWVRVGISGVVRADMLFPPPDRFCMPTMNSSGMPGRIDLSGSTSVTMNDGVLLVSQCPHDSFAFAFFGDGQGQVVFGNGVRCVTGTLHRLPSFQLSANGTASVALDLDHPPLSNYLRPGTTWGFQCGFRDPAAGGAALNATDAIRLRFVP